MTVTTEVQCIVFSQYIGKTCTVVASLLQAVIIINTLAVADRRNTPCQSCLSHDEQAVHGPPDHECHFSSKQPERGT